MDTAIVAQSDLHINYYYRIHTYTYYGGIVCISSNFIEVVNNWMYKSRYLIDKLVTPDCLAHHLRTQKISILFLSIDNKLFCKRNRNNYS